jgi:hypothetical protein
MTGMCPLILVTSYLDRKAFPYVVDSGERPVERPGMLTLVNEVEG